MLTTILENMTFSSMLPRARQAAFLLLLAFSSTATTAAPVTFRWDYTASGAAGFMLYCGSASRTYTTKVDVGNTDSHTISTLKEGATSYCAVTAYDSSKAESSYSNEASVSVPYSTPSASFSASPISGAAPLSVKFTDTSTGQITSWAWNFGDGTSSTAQHPTKSYANAGTYTVTLTATASNGTKVTATRNGYVQVSAPGTPASYSLWSSSARPVITADPDTNSVNLGVKFRSAQDGYITGIRFYKSTYNTGTHVGALWTSSGQKLAQATFTNETASGWQQVLFSTPVRITANTVYVASYLAPRGRYAGDNGYFSSRAVTNNALTALQSGTSGANGVYAYGSTVMYPSSSYRATNYWVDVVFRPAQ
jgi:PKD repeat protein